MPKDAWKKHRNPYPGPRLGKILDLDFSFFPGYIVFNVKMLCCRVMDVFLSEGIEVIFRIALTLLMLGNPRVFKFKIL
jgi:hypothetical protein